jgi:hypothetical protein
VNGATPLFGAQIITGDLNGDHLVDLVVSAPGYNYGTLSSCGGVYIYYADDKGEFPAAPDDYFIGVDGEMIGSSLALTDLNSDNRLELAIASHSNNVVYIIPSESISSGLNILANMVNISTLFSHDSDESFGISMIATPNVVPDNDQMSELLIGAPFMDAEEATDDTYSSQQEGVIISINGAAIPYQNYNMP